MGGKRGVVYPKLGAHRKFDKKAVMQRSARSARKCITYWDYIHVFRRRKAAAAVHLNATREVFFDGFCERSYSTVFVYSIPLLFSSPDTRPTPTGWLRLAH